MPIVTVKLLEGRTDEQLKNLVTEVTDAVERTTNAKREAISVIIEEMKKNTSALLVYVNQTNNTKTPCLIENRGFNIILIIQKCLNSLFIFSFIYT